MWTLLYLALILLGEIFNFTEEIAFFNKILLFVVCIWIYSNLIEPLINSFDKRKKDEYEDLIYGEYPNNDP